VKAKRLVSIFSAFACVLFCWAAIKWLTPERALYRSEGEHLELAKLQRGEEVTVVKYRHRHRQLPEARLFQFALKSNSRTVDVFEASASFSNETLYATPEKLLLSRILTDQQSEGLDILFSASRKSQDYDVGHETLRYRVTYFREERKIGEEYFVAPGLPGQLEHLDSQARRDDPDYDLDYARLAAAYGLDRSSLIRVVTLEMLESEPNKAPEPTPGAVMPRAIEGDSR
jgi:hypothetical protein